MNCVSIVSYFTTKFNIFGDFSHGFWGKFGNLCWLDRRDTYKETIKKVSYFLVEHTVTEVQLLSKNPF